MPLDARILIADDDPINRQLLTHALTAEGCEVVAVENGLRAVRLLRSEGTTFDVVLLDVMMPEMDGYEVLRYMKGDSVLTHLPVIMVSALDDIASVVRGVQLGADDYLTKPFDPVLLRARLTNSLARKQLGDTQRLYLKLLEEEEKRAERLILNILPPQIAERLKLGESVIADDYADVSVVFSDVVGFTTLAAKRTAGDVVALLDRLFTAFDSRALERGLEKIKTIGDAYLAVGGLSGSDGHHVEAAVDFALDMVDTAAAMTDEVQIRAGVHVGPVVAGVIGSHKFCYDLWGDTVNIAARMESNSSPGMVHVTEAVRGRLPDRFVSEDRGLVELRNRGAMRGFFVTRSPTETVTIDLTGDGRGTPAELVRRS